MLITPDTQICSIQLIFSCQTPQMFHHFLPQSNFQSPSFCLQLSLLPDDSTARFLKHVYTLTQFLSQVILVILLIVLCVKTDYLKYHGFGKMARFSFNMFSKLLDFLCNILVTTLKKRHCCVAVSFHHSFSTDLSIFCHVIPHLDITCTSSLSSLYTGHSFSPFLITQPTTFFL